MGERTDYVTYVHQVYDYLHTIPEKGFEEFKTSAFVLEELKKNYDYILLDNPPYGVVVDTQLCGRLADQTVYVVRSGLFDKRMLPELQELYDSGKMKNMSILLNGIDYVKTGYGYGYGYGYGNYGNDENRKNKKPLYKRIFGI